MSRRATNDIMTISMVNRANELQEIVYLRFLYYSINVKEVLY